MTATRDLVADQREQFAFHDDIAYLRETKRGLTRETVEEISGFKGEPDWMLQARLRAYDHFVKRPMPTWTDGLDRIDFDKIVYYRKPSEREEKSWDDVPEQIKATFERLGIPEAERKFLAGVGAQYDSEVVYHSVREELRRSAWSSPGWTRRSRTTRTSSASTSRTVVPAEDNKFSALNTAVWSGGSFVYVPKGVEVPLPLQAYFRINGENTGQFERTLIVVEEGAKVHYIEGCTAPIYATDSLHAAVVEVVALPGSKVRYTTIQNWSNDVYNLVTKRAHAYANSTVEWIDANTGSRKTVKFPSIYLRGENATADIISVAVAGKGQHQDTGAKAIHLAPNTKSRIVSKSVSKDGGRATYRGHLKVSPGRDERRRQRPLRRADARRPQPQRHVPVHRHPGRRHDDDPRGHRREDQRRAGLLPDEPRPDRERGAEPDRPGLPRGVHEGAPDGVRDRVQPAREARDGGVARVIDATAQAAASARPARAPRRAPSELSFTLDEALVEAWAAERAATGSRPTGARPSPATGDLPVETNQLYTTYVDLRTADLGEVRPWDGPPRPRRGAPRGAAVPDGVAAFASIVEDRVEALVLSDEARAAGVVLDTVDGLVARDEALARRLLADEATLPLDDKLAQLTRAGWNQGLVLHVPAGVRLDAPGRPALVGRGGRARAADPDDRRSRRGRGGVDRRGARGLRRGRRPWRAAGAVHRHARGPPRHAARSSASRASRTCPKGPSRSSIARPRSARARRSTGRWPSSARGSSGAASTTASSATAARSSRSRSSSAPRTSCST